VSKKYNIDRLHIGLFGRRNTGKSSVINRLTGQNLSIVSDIPGTTTDPVKKAVEIPGLGPVVLIDTAGIDDAGELGQQRVKKTKQAIKQVDIAIVVFCNNHFDNYEQQLIKELQQLRIPFILLHNKSDEHPADVALLAELHDCYKTDVLEFSAKTGENSETLLQLIKKNIPANFGQLPPLFGDKLISGDLVLLVTPIDSEAPEGRLILPQVQAIREALDFNCIAVILKETEVKDFMNLTSLVPALVITDSQLFGRIDKLIPPEIPLTSFSILLARQKGNFEAYLKGTPHIDKLQNGDRILIMESCTHHSTCDDIGRVKSPRWLQE
jgi:[FeFe] hydrogenase H-cluster maturation GTPase HydF